MKRKTKRIVFVRCITHTSTGAYCWFVRYKVNKQLLSKEFIHYDKEGKSCRMPYPLEELPKDVQDFVLTHPMEETDTNLPDRLKDENTHHYIYR